MINNGTISILGTNVRFGSTVWNYGHIQVPSSLVCQDLVLEGGSISASSLHFSDGDALCGNGTITADLFNAGSVRPGSSPGTIHIDGNYSQTGFLEIEVLGAGSGLFDQMIISGSAELGGTLDIKLLDGARFEEGDVFRFMEAGMIDGSFDDVILPMLEGSPLFFLAYDSTGAELVAMQTVPEPATLSILAFSGLALLRRKRR